MQPELVKGFTSWQPEQVFDQQEADRSSQQQRAPGSCIEVRTKQLQ